MKAVVIYGLDNTNWDESGELFAHPGIHRILAGVVEANTGLFAGRKFSRIIIFGRPENAPHTTHSAKMLHQWERDYLPTRLEDGGKIVRFGSTS